MLFRSLITALHNMQERRFLLHSSWIIISQESDIHNHKAMINIYTLNEHAETRMCIMVGQALKRRGLQIPRLFPLRAPTQPSFRHGPSVNHCEVPICRPFPLAFNTTCSNLDMLQVDFPNVLVWILPFAHAERGLILYSCGGEGKQREELCATTLFAPNVT